jgi:hypothetical protein
MTDNTPRSDPFIDPTSWLASEQKFERLCESIRPENKAALFDALARAGITSVEVTFDGYGDSGQIESVMTMAGDTEVALPVVSITIAHAEWGCPDVKRGTYPLEQAVEQLAYDFLRETHCGWENNAGAYGDFYFNVAERTITLNHNRRFESSDHTQHVF